MQPHDRTSPSHFVNRMREIEIEREREKKGCRKYEGGAIGLFSKMAF